MFICKVNEYIIIWLLELKDVEWFVEFIIENQQWFGQWLFWVEYLSSVEMYREMIILDWWWEYVDFSSIEVGFLYDGILCGMIGLYYLDQIN